MNPFTEMLRWIALAGACTPAGAGLARIVRFRPPRVDWVFCDFAIAFGGGVLVGAVALVLEPEGSGWLPDPLAAALLLLACGHEGRDPEIRDLANGEIAASFTMGTTERRKDREGKPAEATEWRWIVALRKRLRLSRQKFADRFGFDVRALQEWEQGRRLPSRCWWRSESRWRSPPTMACPEQRRPQRDGQQRVLRPQMTLSRSRREGAGRRHFLPPIPGPRFCGSQSAGS